MAESSSPASPSAPISRDEMLAEVMELYSPSARNPHLLLPVSVHDSEPSGGDGDGGSDTSTVFELAAASPTAAWSPLPVLEHLDPALVAMTKEMPLPDGNSVYEKLAGKVAANKASADLIFDHWACVSLRHQALLEMNEEAERTLAVATQSAASAVSASVLAATEETAQHLLRERCNVAVVSRPGGKCNSPWRSCPLLAHAHARATCGLPSREVVPCPGHPRIVRSSCRVCAERRRLRLLFSLHQ